MTGRGRKRERTNLGKNDRKVEKSNIIVGEVHRSKLHFQSAKKYSRNKIL